MEGRKLKKWKDMEKSWKLWGYSPYMDWTEQSPLIKPVKLQGHVHEHSYELLYHPNIRTITPYIMVFVFGWNTTIQ